jgi:hypothetical protein
MTPNRREFPSTTAAAVVAPSPSPDRIDLAEWSLNCSYRAALRVGGVFADGKAFNAKVNL